MKGNSTALTVDALARLYDTGAERVRPSLIRRGCRREDFDDLRQDSFIAAMKHVEEFEGDSEGVVAWVGTIIKNRFLNFMRDSSLRERKETIAAREWAARLRALHGRDASKEALIERMSKAMSLLSPDDQRVMWLHYAEGIATGEIAKREGADGPAIRKRLERARTRLREIYTRLEP